MNMGVGCESIYTHVLSNYVTLMIYIQSSVFQLGTIWEQFASQELMSWSLLLCREAEHYWTSVSE